MWRDAQDFQTHSELAPIQWLEAPQPTAEQRGSVCFQKRRTCRSQNLRGERHEALTLVARHALRAWAGLKPTSANACVTAMGQKVVRKQRRYGLEGHHTTRNLLTEFKRFLLAARSSLVSGHLFRLSVHPVHKHDLVLHIEIYIEYRRTEQSRHSTRTSSDFHKNSIGGPLNQSFADRALNRSCTPVVGSWGCVLEDPVHCLFNSSLR